MDTEVRGWETIDAPQEAAAPAGHATPTSLLRSRLHVKDLLRRVHSDSLLRNSLFIMATTLVNSACGFFFWLIAARLFDARIVGLTAATVSASTVIMLLGTLGVGGTMIHALARRDDEESWSLTVWAGVAIAIVTSLVLGGLAIFIVPIAVPQLESLHHVTYAGVFAVGTLATAIGAVIDYVFIAQRTAVNMFGRNGIVAAAKVVMVGLVTLVVGRTALSLLDAWALASLVGLGIGLSWLFRRSRTLSPSRLSLIARRAVELRSLIAGHQLIGMGAALLPYLMPVIVTARLSAQDNAYFYTTWMLAGIFLIISPALSQSLFAEGAYSPDQLAKRVRTTLGVIGAVLLPSLLVVLVAGGLLLSAFGPAYESHALGLLRIVLLASVPDAITNIYISVLRVRRRLAVAARLNLAMGIGVCIMSWMLLPSVGINAVGWSFLAMQLGGCVFVASDLRRSSSRAGVSSQSK